MKTIELYENDSTLLFSNTEENNTLEKTIKKALKNGIELADLNLNKADLRKTNLSNLDLSYIDFSGADLSNTKLI